jgi:NADH-quinone oxidoreductase subunit J
MMTRRLMQTSENPRNSQAIAALAGVLISFAILVVVLTRYLPLAPDPGSLYGAALQVDPALLESSVVRMGRAFVSADAYVLPFEIASVLLLAALVGSIIIAWPRSGEEENL